MKRTLKIFLAFVFILFLWWVLIYEPSIEFGPGQFAPDVPMQTSASEVAPFNFEEFIITPKAKFNITARVLSRKNYSRGLESELSPVDFVLGWGSMSDEIIFNQISFSQRDRWFFWRTDKFPISRREIEKQCANMHMIPATDEIRSRLDEVIKGDLINIEGFLVYVSGTGNWKWKSSLSRDDTGGGSCEIIWVNDFRNLNPL